MSFQQFMFRDFVNQTITDLEFTTPTEIQNKVIPKILANESVIGKSETGSGKTHAFLLPLMQKINLKIEEVQAVIISPTRELALQLFTMANAFVKNAPSLDIRLFTGGSNRPSEIDRLTKKQPQIIIGTLGKISDLVLEANILKIHTARLLIIDEADMVFERSEVGELDKLLSRFAPNTQIATFTATMTPQVSHFINRYLGGMKVIDCTKGFSKSSIEHFFLPTKNKDKKNLLYDLLQTFSPYIVIIFANTRLSVDEVAEFLLAKGLKLLKLTGDLAARERKQTIKRIKSGEFQYVVASDIVARGLDIEGVSHIINYDLPSDIEFYVHRSGRTARHEASGQVISLYDYQDNQYLDKLMARGLSCKYVKIENGTLIPIRGRNIWRKKPQSVLSSEEEVHKAIPVAKVVKPAHRKKRLKMIKQKINKMKRTQINKLYRKKNFKK